MSDVIYTRNLYLDSSSGVKGNGRNFEIYVPSHGFTVKENEYMRFTVQSMLGYKNWTNINESNDRFVLKFTCNGIQYTDALTLTHYNHPNIKTLADDFANKISAQILARAGVAVQNPVNGTVSENDTDNPHDKKLSVSMTVPATVTALDVLFYRVAGDVNNLHDTHLLLGGRVNETTAGAISGLNVALNGQSLAIASFYPMQKTTMTHVYLRSSLTTDNYQNHHFDMGAAKHDNFLIESTVLCKAPIHDEFFSYDDMNSQGTGFLVNAAQKSLTYMQFSLTTDKDLPLPVTDNQQPISGNTSVQICIRMDVLRAQ